jgi:hypothetical protein
VSSLPPVAPHAAEARRRWGHTDAFRVSQRRAASYDAADWAAIHDQAHDIDVRLAVLMAEGVPADDPAAGELAEEHRAHLARWFYDCPPALHCALADLYDGDERFAAHYDEVAPGLGSYLAAAIRANAGRLDA